MIDIKNEIDKFKKLTEEPFPIVLFGSSNTAANYGSRGSHNWGEWLHRVLRVNAGMNFKVINSGIGGDTTEKLLARIKRDVLYYRPKAVILTVGGNDCCIDLGMDVFERNLNRIVDIFNQNSIIPILQTYYVLDYSAFNSSVPGKDERIKREFPLYMDIVRKISKERNIMMIDQYKYFEPLYRQNLGLYKRLMIDDMHVSYIGNFIIANNIARILDLGEIQIPEDVKEEFLFFLTEMDKLNANELTKVLQ